MKMTVEEKQARKEERKIEKRKKAEIEAIEKDKNQPKVEKIIIKIEWRKSRTWGMNPHATAEVYFSDNNFIRQAGYSCSGCGYDKESTVIAQIFNDFLKSALYKAIENNPEKRVYGIRRYKSDETNNLICSYSEGVGTTCYYPISEFIGGKFCHITGGSSFDVYSYDKVEN